MKSKWIKGLLFLVIAILIVGTVKATMFYGGGHPSMKQVQGGISQLEQKFHSGVAQVNPRMDGRDQLHNGKQEFRKQPEGRNHHFAGKGHRGGFWLGSLLTIAFWGGLLVLSIAWFRKRQKKHVGSNFALESLSAVQIPTQTGTNAAFLDQWEKENTQLKEDK